jgi:hypothetical protein
MIIKSVNLLVFVSLPLSIWLGLSGQVSWPTLVLIWLMHCSLDLKFKG